MSLVRFPPAVRFDHDDLLWMVQALDELLRASDRGWPHSARGRVGEARRRLTTAISSATAPVALTGDRAGSSAGWARGACPEVQLTVVVDVPTDELLDAAADLLDAADLLCAGGRLVDALALEGAQGRLIEAALGAGRME